MTRYCALLFCLVLSAALGFIPGCTLAGGDPGGGESVPLLPPDNVEVELVDGNFLVSWGHVAGAASYTVYRQEGAGEIVLVTAQCSANAYTDTIETSQPVRYSVRCITVDNKPSDKSKPSKYISKYVLNIKASKFEYTDRILVSWDVHQVAVTYNVYRYQYKTDAAPAVFTKITTPSFTDLYDPANAAGIRYNIPYYYRITWVDAAKKENGLDGAFVLGVFGTARDYYEPNDDYRMLTGETASTVFNPLQPPKIFSFGDEAGGVDSDVDWYLYYGSAENFFVTIQLPADSPFLDGELRFRFLYNNREYPEQAIRGSVPNLFNFQAFGAVTGTVSVYFKIYPVVPASRDVAGDYSVNIRNEL